jgi:threonine/homoserine/homoserine lactone efflux protein
MTVLGVADYPAFVLAVIVFLAIPGPGNLAIVTSTGKRGVRGGLAAAGGLIVGDQVLLWLAVAGVAALLAAHPQALAAIRWVGAAYLAWLGFSLLRSRGGPGSGPRLPVAITAGREARQAFLITLLNPKAIVFYMAFFPLFLDPARPPSLPTFAAMAATIAVLTFLYCLLVTLLTHRLAERLRASPRAVRWLNRIAGTAMVAFGIRVALDR